MNVRALAIALGLAATAPAFAGDATTKNFLHRIVGVWANEARVGPCGGPPGGPQYQTLAFHAGGTFSDNPRFPPQGAQTPGGHVSRSIGLGTWDFNWRTGKYTLDQQFDWYLDGQYDGFQTVHRTITVGNGGDTLSGPVLTIRYNADGSQRFELCGTAVSNRI